MIKTSIAFIILLVSLVACEQKPKTETTPWGTTITLDNDNADIIDSSEVKKPKHMTMKDIQQAGEMIMLTLSGPDTYYEYHGRGVGVHYLLCEKFAESIGVTLRVDVCRDTLDMIERLKNGEGDVIAFPMPRKGLTGLIFCGVNESKGAMSKGREEVSWMVAKDNTELADALNSWYKTGMYAETEKQENYLLTTGSVKRHVYPFMLSAKEGTISQYDALFKKHAPTAGVDWSLLAAQCYQESCFDPQAHSWAGACGLMQILPTTADHLVLPREKIYEPEANIAAATRYLRELQGLFSDVGNPQERLMFALAAYNGGYNHVRDAMALTKKNGGVWQRWSDVRHYILALSQPQYYRDPVVKNGYMRGAETANYVDMIMTRWSQYRHALRTGGKVVSAVRKGNTPAPVSSAFSTMGAPHRKSGKKNKWRQE